MSNHISQENSASNDQVVEAPSEYQIAQNKGQETGEAATMADGDTTMAEGASEMNQFGVKNDNLTKKIQDRRTRVYDSREIVLIVVTCTGRARDWNVPWILKRLVCRNLQKIT